MQAAYDRQDRQDYIRLDTELHRTLVQNCEAFRRWLEVLWAELPEALPTQTAAELVGHNPQRIHELIKGQALHGIKIGSTQYCAKEEFICYMASPQKLSNPRAERYKELIREFKYKQRRERENEQRRCKRRMKRGENID